MEPALGLDLNFLCPQQRENLKLKKGSPSPTTGPLSKGRSPLDNTITLTPRGN